MRSSICATAVLVLAVTSPARAGFQVRLDGTGAGVNGTVAFTDGHGHSGSLTGFVGQLQMTFDVGGTGRAFNSFTINPFNPMRGGQVYTMDVYALGQAPTFHNWPSGGAMAYLYNTYGQSAVANAIDAAALQLAFWQLALGPNGTLTTTGIASEVLSRQQALLAEANAGSNHQTAGRWLSAGQANTSYRPQGVLFDATDGGGPPTLANPAPAGIVLLLTGGVAGLCGWVYRIRRAGRGDVEAQK